VREADVDPARRVVRWVEAGAGEPAVVLEAGMNCGAASWQRVMPLLAPHVRTVAYDRAGLGGSAPAPALAVLDRQIDDLASVITGLRAVSKAGSTLPRRDSVLGFRRANETGPPVIQSCQVAPAGEATRTETRCPTLTLSTLRS
jgi:pimeloyl-ACP methyl ester carboxylesterase